MAYQFNNEVLNAILLDLGVTTTYPQDIDALNAILLQLGGTGGHHYMIDAYNELCTIQSVSSNHYYLIDALNAINVGGGGTSEIFELPALVQLGAKLNLLDRIKADSTIETADNSKFRELFSQLNDQFTALYNLTGI